MNRRYAVLALLLIGSALVTGAVFVAGGRLVRGQSQSNATENSHSLARINDKAGRITGSDEAAIRSLTDEVFNGFDSSQAPAGTVDAIKERLVRAEINYRAGVGKGVSEFGIVRMHNLLAGKLGVPDYAMTNVFEVRRFEMNALPYIPNLIGRSNAAKAIGSSFNATLSPIQAFSIATLLMQQKLYNEDYQVTQAEWVAKHGGNHATKEKNPSNGGKSEKPRSREIDEAIERGAGSLRSAELLNLPGAALDALGIERNEGRTKP
ncbi:MAG: hypothetical protein ABI923_08210 [bacterium]